VRGLPGWLWPVSPWLYLVLGVAALVVCWALSRDWARDPGGYVDVFVDPYQRLPKGAPWWHRIAPDKRLHARYGFLLGFGSVLLTHGTWWRLLADAGVSLVLFWGWEWIEAHPRRPFRDPLGHLTGKPGFMSWRDVVADSAGWTPGALLALLTLFLVSLL
jgi:hypothetical protein